jgi:molybdate/tungstate transport system substrate-binding protein
LIAANALSDPVGAATKTTLPQGTGPVDVLYAGSLVTLMQQQIGPAFQKATGYTVNGVSAGSKALATQIKGGIQQADVFISAAPDVNATLEGPAGGGWITWYAAFGSSPLVLGYNPHSAFASALKNKPWYKVVTEPGFLLGRTDPATDPKGTLAVEALDYTSVSYSIPALKDMTSSTTTVFPETTLVGRLQAGQLDAGFFYAVEAAAAKIKTVPLKGTTHLAATYTITILNRAPHEDAARAFVAFLLGKESQKILKVNGVTTVQPPVVTGASSIPSNVKALFKSKK